MGVHSCLEPNLYAFNRAKGIVRPSSTLSTSGSTYAVQVTNHEPANLEITSARVDLIPCDPALDVRRQPLQSLSVSIGPSTTTLVNVAAPSAIPSDVCSLGVHLMGTTAAGAVYADAYRRLKDNPLLSHAVSDPATIALLDTAATLTGNAERLTETELRRLVAQAKIPRMPPATPPGNRYADPGDNCEPGEVPPFPGGLVCQATQDWVKAPPEIVNAFKGEFIMDHGCGSIGKLLAAVRQKYSHTSVITRNRVEVRHSTASSDRVDDSLEADRFRLDPAKLKFGFPGTNGNRTHTIDEMVHEYFLEDPDDSEKPPKDRRKWKMGLELSPFPTQCDGESVITPGLVVHAVPDASPQLLQNIASVADESFSINSHYRFFHYTKSDFTSSGEGWASGTEPTVCSSFEWLAAQRKGLPLQPNREAKEVPDGLSSYSVERRLSAAHALHDNVFNKVREACSVAETAGGVFGITLSLWGGAALPAAILYTAVSAEGADASCEVLALNIANQMVNCFGNDRCDDLSPTWLNPGRGIAVSPDDVLSWETAGTGGTYGYNEPFVYSETEFHHRFVWVKDAAASAMTIKVVHPDNTPYPGARVFLNGWPLGATNASGEFNIPTLAAGNYEVEAQFNPCSSEGPPDGGPCTLPLERARRPGVIVPEGASKTVVLTLCAGECQQRCESDEDCDIGTSLVCRNTLCVPQPRVVRVQSTASLGVDTQVPMGEPEPTGIGYTLPVDVTVPCNTVGDGTAQYVFCATSPTAHQYRLEIDFFCHQEGDQQGGGLKTRTEVTLRQGCSPGAPLWGGFQPFPWDSFLVPPSPSNPNPQARHDDFIYQWYDLVGVGVFDIVHINADFQYTSNPAP